MGRAAKYVAIYDVSEDRERRRVARLLEGFGVRVQRSAFECHLSHSHREQLRRRLEELHLSSGFVCLYRQQAGSRRQTAGIAPENPVDDAHYAFVL